MLFEELKNISEHIKDNELVKLKLDNLNSIFLYPRSVSIYGNSYLFIANENTEKYLFILTENEKLTEFEGEIVNNYEGNIELRKCIMSHVNAKALQDLFPFTKPSLVGLKNSFGFGDRLGLANPAHIRALEGSKFKPIIAQQSIRELTRTQRKPHDVMDAAVWAVFQEGYKEGFGSDADHLKSIEDIDLMVEAGFTMFTFDPGEYVLNEADHLTTDELTEKSSKVDFKFIEDSVDSLIMRYEKIKFKIDEKFVLEPEKEQVLRASVKYLGAISHIKFLYNYLLDNYSNKPFEIEISVDETEAVTTPFEHFFMASELKRLQINFVSLAPRFIGDFEKGIDYKGNIELFKKEYIKHAKIAQYFGSYKISLHSGSDKFTVYKAIGQINKGFTHVKTAGTSYLEALKVVAFVEPYEFRKILDFSRMEFEKEKQSYHVSADLNKVKSSSNYSDEQLLELFQNDDARQVLHVTYGKVLTTKNKNSEFLFRSIIYGVLKENEKIHYNFLVNHFKDHLNPFSEI